MTEPELIKAISDLKVQKNAVVLAHYYVDSRIQDICDFLGDSLELARKAAVTDASLIVFCGVHFMAETAAVLCPGKKVLVPAQGAGCSLADSICGEDLLKWKERHPDGVVISYVNTTAETKAHTDICCTSANAVKVVKAVYDGTAVPPADGNLTRRRPVLFCPDLHLGSYVNRVLGTDMEIWDGQCVVHHRITSRMVKEAMKNYPDADILIHPESDCSMDPEITGDPRCFFYSTSGIIKHASESGNRQFIIATENGVLHKLQKECPDKEIIPISSTTICNDMKKITLENLYEAISEEKYQVSIPDAVARKAALPIKRMLVL